MPLLSWCQHPRAFICAGLLVVIAKGAVQLFVTTWTPGNFGQGCDA
jgi:hypothetical protein